MVLELDGPWWLCSYLTLNDEAAGLVWHVIEVHKVKLTSDRKWKKYICNVDSTENMTANTITTHSHSIWRPVGCYHLELSLMIRVSMAG